MSVEAPAVQRIIQEWDKKRKVRVFQWGQNSSQVAIVLTENGRSVTLFGSLTSDSTTDPATFELLAVKLGGLCLTAGYHTSACWPYIGNQWIETVIPSQLTLENISSLLDHYLTDGYGPKLAFQVWALSFSD